MVDLKGTSRFTEAARNVYVSTELPREPTRTNSPHTNGKIPVLGLANHARAPQAVGQSVDGSIRSGEVGGLHRKACRPTGHSHDTLIPKEIVRAQSGAAADLGWAETAISDIRICHRVGRQ